jgi:hypothetical protein
LVATFFNKITLRHRDLWYEFHWTPEKEMYSLSENSCYWASLKQQKKNNNNNNNKNNNIMMHPEGMITVRCV